MFTVSNPGGGEALDKSNETSNKLDCTGLYVTVSDPGGGGGLTRAMKCLTNWTALDSMLL